MKNGAALPAPIFKSIGSKTQLLGELVKYIPDSFTAYIEPMVGGGAFFWELARNRRLDGKQVLLADLNPDIVRVYEMVQQQPGLLIHQLDRFETEYMKGPEQAEALYYRTRDRYNEDDFDDPVEATAGFIFLRQTAFNGLWRLNRKGQMNAAWGKYTNPRICQETNITVAYETMKRFKLLTSCGSVETVLNGLDNDACGMFVYIDPPYLTKKGFNKFTAEGFGRQQHEQLLQSCAGLARRGASVLYSNSLHAVELFDQLDGINYVRGEVMARDKVNRDGKGRGLRAELLVSFPPQHQAATRRRRAASK